MRSSEEQNEELMFSFRSLKLDLNWIKSVYTGFRFDLNKTALGKYLDIFLKM